MAVIGNFRNGKKSRGERQVAECGAAENGEDDCE